MPLAHSTCNSSMIYFVAQGHMSLDVRKPVLAGLPTTQTQTSLRSLLSAFVIRFSESIIHYLVTGEISIFYLVSVAKETGLKLTFSETPKTSFLLSRPIYACTFEKLFPHDTHI